MQTDQSAPHAWNCNKSNPAPLVFRTHKYRDQTHAAATALGVLCGELTRAMLSAANGTILLGYRGQRCIRDPTCRNATHNSCEMTGIAVADNYLADFVDRQGKFGQGSFRMGSFFQEYLQ